MSIGQVTQSRPDAQAQEAAETPAQTTQQAASGDVQAARKLTPTQLAAKHHHARAAGSSPGPAAVDSISAKAQALAASSADADHDRDKK